MLYGNVCSTHKLWYTVLLKVRTYLIYSLVSFSQTSSNIFALCSFWCKEPCLPAAVAAPSFPCQGNVHHVLSAEQGPRPTGISPGTLGCPGQGLCNCPAFEDRPEARSQHPALWVTLYWVQLFCGFRPDFPTASCHLEQLKKGCDLPKGQGYAFFALNTSTLSSLHASLWKRVVSAAYIHWVEQLPA